ncbi:hypothetical protein [Oerskovia paurometabola]|uniref:hypothetical protein n=1 Tax=Oerskovia paurometabola TaxID=162170 RepID=UPI00381805C7
MVVLVLVAGGCAASTRASTTGSLDSISESLDESSSATATAVLVADLVSAGRIPAVTADAALEDAVSSADAATHALTTIVVPDAEVLAVQERALEVAQQAARAVVATRVWVGGGSPERPGAVREALEQSGSDLQDITEQVEDLLEDGTS